jgi:hypothetical protein
MKASICWTAGSGLYSYAIRWLDPGKYNHVLYRFRTDTGLDLVYESLGGTGVTLSPASHLEDAIKDKRVYAYHELPLEIGHAGAMALWSSCTARHGRGYDWRQILLYVGMLRLGFKSAVNTRNDPLRFTCNEFVIESGRDIIPALDQADFSLTPEGLYRLLHGRASLA